jgi:hypothetical protein
LSDDAIDQMPPTEEELDRASLDASMSLHPSSWNTAEEGPRTRVYEHDSGDQVLVTTYANGTMTVALRLKGWTSWGPPLKRVIPDA